MEAEVPIDRRPVPRAVSQVAADRVVRPVWRNDLGGRTFEVATGPARSFIKWTPVTSGIDLSREVARLAWAAPYTPVPVVLDEGSDDEGTWMVTAALAGENAIAAQWKARPAVAVAAIGEGLRAMHDALPVARCPFSWSAEDRLADTRRRLAAGRLDATNWDPMHQRLGIEAAVELLACTPPIDHLVVCHGDSCPPNTLLSDDGRWSAHVDLGDLGVADRWADLAVATMAVGWNYGTGWEHVLLASYGVAPDPERTRYYRLMWDLDP